MLKRVLAQTARQDEIPVNIVYKTPRVREFKRNSHFSVQVISAVDTRLARLPISGSGSRQRTIFLAEQGDCIPGQLYYIDRSTTLW